MLGTDPRMLGTDPDLLVSPTALREGACVYELMEQDLIEDPPRTDPRRPGCGVLGSAFSVGGKRKAESGKRNAESGMRQAECGKRNAASGMRQAECGKRTILALLSQNRPLAATRMHFRMNHLSFPHPRAVHRRPASRRNRSTALSNRRNDRHARRTFTISAVAIRRAWSAVSPSS